MPRCKGITKSGARCRRPAAAESDYCNWHSAAEEVESGRDETEPGPEASERDGEAHPDVEAGERDAAPKSDDETATEDAAAAGGTEDGAGRRRRRRRKHPLADAAVVGIIAIGLMVLRRIIRR